MPVPYAGNPASFPANINVLAGSDLPNTGNFNSPFEGLADRTAYLNANLSSEVLNRQAEFNALSCQNWCPAFGPTSLSDIAHIFWDDYGPPGEWVMVTASTSHWQAQKSFGLDGGAAASWPAFGAAQARTNLISVAGAADYNPSSPYIYYMIDTSNPTPYAVNITKWDGASWTAGGFMSSTTTALYGVSAVMWNYYQVFAIAAATHPWAGNADIMFASSNDDFATHHYYADSTGWSGNLPAGSEWLLKVNATQAGIANGSSHVLAIPGHAALGTTTPVYLSYDGHTWAQTGMLPGLAAGNSVVGLAWSHDAVGPCWVVMVQTGAFTTKVLRSPDGIHWTTQLGTPPSFAISDMAGFEDVGSGFTFPGERSRGALVCSLKDEASPYASGQIFSLDGGVTWETGQARLFANDVGSPAFYTRARVIGSEFGFCTFNSTWARFSVLTGAQNASF